MDKLLSWEIYMFDCSKCAQTINKKLKKGGIMKISVLTACADDANQNLKFETRSV